MKKYKVYWSVFNLFSETQKEVVKLQSMWAAIAGSATASTWLASSDSYALYVALAAAVVDKLIAGIYLEESK